MPIVQEVQSLRVFVATWNVGGQSPPDSGLDLDQFLQVRDPSDIYILGFQEIVPLNAGNVLVIEDNGTAAKWLSLISNSLNQSTNGRTNSKTISSFGIKPLVRGSPKPNSAIGSSLFFQKTSLKAATKIFRGENARMLKSCNCTLDFLERKYSKDSCSKWQESNISENDSSSDDEGITGPSSTNQMSYSLVVSKQMVGIFVTVWVRNELIPHIGHLRTSYTSRGIMGCLGNKGCISVSMSIHQTSFCFVCSHLASGEKEGDELRRNSDVIETLRNTQFPKICRTPNNKIPEKILEHDRIIWLGDLNYRIALSYSDTKKLLVENKWDTLLGKDQLKMEMEAGRVFKGWKEGKIYFAPTYKYSYNSDTYAGDTINSKDKRRTPAWCDRILWHGNGIKLLSYVRREIRFSDHRPVLANFLVDVMVVKGGLKKGLSNSNMKVEIEELLPKHVEIFIE
ncbi:type I inositol polyphosphate 5-phosphatase 10-like isoform X2 [Cornus florida]|nr:type I inositol polyphosphate 5-phosphatase 10-like isoform X2 [Cornus florida]XP_059653736.1 type I inositol polyphosphate 5-phosphatase 10-like isoform X2 [Cornus florida]